MSTSVQFPKDRQLICRADVQWLATVEGMGGREELVPRGGFYATISLSRTAPGLA